MEQFTLKVNNGIRYFEKQGQNFLINYSLPMSLFGDGYLNVQINHKPVIKKTFDFFEMIEGALPFKADQMPAGIKETIQSMFKDPSALKGMFEQFGIKDERIKNFNFDNLQQDKITESTFESFRQRTGIQFHAILGRDILNQYIILYEKEDVDGETLTFFSERYEVGEKIGDRYHITDFDVKPYGILIPGNFKVNGKKVALTLDGFQPNCYLKNKVFQKLISKITTMPKTKMETAFFNEVGTVNSTLFQLNLELPHRDAEHVWVGELPDIKESVLAGFSEVDGIASFFMLDTVLIDGIHQKFGYQKSE